MNSQKITIVARILAKEEKGEFVKAELLKLAGLSKSDKGCVNYDLHQDKENADLFFVHENWVNRDSLQKHVESKHFANYVKVTEGAVEEFVVNEMFHIA
nr:putative quinol monooxygenase [uncultured Marinifilum sp.]